MISVLFVCLGNICRSPMAEAVFRHLLEKEGLDSKVRVDSAGIAGWHVGKHPHQGTQAVLKEKGISVQGLQGRQITKEDLQTFDYIIAMDQKNVGSIKDLAESDAIHIHLLTDFTEDLSLRGKEVPDPYHTGRFDETFDLVEAGCLGLMWKIKKDL
ncbi:MAG: low molecular weight protein-tyrosine-phosphatase [Tuberibacillus sp.]